MHSIMKPVTWIDNEEMSSCYFSVYESLCDTVIRKVTTGNPPGAKPPVSGVCLILSLSARCVAHFAHPGTVLPLNEQKGSFTLETSSSFSYCRKSGFKTIALASSRLLMLFILKRSSFHRNSLVSLDFYFRFICGFLFKLCGNKC